MQSQTAPLSHVDRQYRYDKKTSRLRLVLSQLWSFPHLRLRAVPCLDSSEIPLFEARAGEQFILFSAHWDQPPKRPRCIPILINVEG